MNENRPRVGVYICHCGINIGAAVNVEEVSAYIATLPGVAASRYSVYMCSGPGQNLIREDIRSGLVNRVVVASCSPRMHEPTFRGACLESGLNPYLYEQVNIREQCSWVNTPGPIATQKAKELIAAAVRRVMLHQPLGERTVTVQGRCVVIGGGVAGLTAALDIAKAGFNVTLIEQMGALGGQAAGLYRTFPTLDTVDSLLQPLLEAVQSHSRISILLNTEVEGVTGYIGNFEVTVRNEQGSTVLPAGTIIIATGYASFDPQRKPELGYSKFPGVVSTRDVEKLLRDQPHALDGVRDVVFVQCVGSRDKQVGNPYCSRLCCMVSVKQAHLLTELLPDARITVLYIDVRAFGKGFEELYDQVRKEGVRYRRGNVSEVIRHGNRLVVRAEDTLLRQPIDLETDLVVLSVGLTPRADSENLSQLFKLARSDDGFFMERHPKLGPVETSVDGIYLAGACQSPKDITETVAHAKAAASAAMIPMLRHVVKVESAVSNVTPELCAGCGLCAANCPYGALAIDMRAGAVRVNPALCKGCGACANICPSNAIKVEHFRPEQILAQIDGLLFPG